MHNDGAGQLQGDWLLDAQLGQSFFPGHLQLDEGGSKEAWLLGGRSEW